MPTRSCAWELDDAGRLQTGHPIHYAELAVAVYAYVREYEKRIWIYFQPRLCLEVIFCDPGAGSLHDLPYNVAA